MAKAVIFDMDGVLVDSEPLYIGMNQKFFRELGAVIPIEEHQTFVGISAIGMWSYIREKFSLEYTVEELIQKEKDMKFLLLQQTELRALRGSEELLAGLRRRNIAIALGTSSLRKNAELILDKTGLRPYFDVLTTGEDVRRGKPNPDLFLLAAERLNKAPHECIVIEDSTNGVKAAKAAGMVCIALSNPNSGAQDLSAADYIIEDFGPGNRELVMQLCGRESAPD
ncbi:MAG TPA: HAD family phosphatase [Puia sp.]|nr:HAD family phosphatase [Puia sp.]